MLLSTQSLWDIISCMSVEASVYERLRADLLRNRNVILAGEVVWGRSDETAPFHPNTDLLTSNIEEVVELFIAPVYPPSLKRLSVKKYEDQMSQFAGMVLDGLRDFPIKTSMFWMTGETTGLSLLEFNETIGMKILKQTDFTAVWDKLAERTGETQEEGEMQIDLYRRIYISPFPNAGLAWLVSLNEESQKTGKEPLPLLDGISKVGYGYRSIDRTKLGDLQWYKSIFDAIANPNS